MDDASLRLEELLQARATMRAALTDLEAEIDRLQRVELTSKNGSIPTTATPSRDAKSRQRPVRSLVLDALDDLGWLTYSREVSHYCRARFGRPIPPERFGPLVNDEIRTYRLSNRPRPLWLCFGLTYDRHEPIKRLLGRSDWPLACRIVAPTTGRVQHLKITSTLCDLALRADETTAEPDIMRIVAADHAQDLPGVTLKRGTFELERWRDIALRLLVELEPRDQEIREESAGRLERRSEFHQLFGLPDVIDGAKPVQLRRERK
jgi:hypothetical protein